MTRPSRTMADTRRRRASTGRMMDEIMEPARSLPLTRQVLADSLETATPAQMEFMLSWMNEELASRERSKRARLPHPRVQRQDQPTQAQQRRQPAGQHGIAPHRHRPPAIPPAHPRLHRQEDPRGQRQARDHTLRQTVHRSRGIPGAHQHTQRRDRTRDPGRTRRQAARTTRQPEHHPATDRRGALRALEPHQR